MTPSRSFVAVSGSLLVIALAGALAGACAKPYAAEESSESADAASLVDASVDADAKPAASTFCVGSMASICDDFSTTISSVWMRRVGTKSSVEIDPSVFASRPSALHATITENGTTLGPFFATIEQQVTLPDSIRDIFVEAKIYIPSGAPKPPDIRVLRVDSRGLPAVLVVGDGSAYLATQSTTLALRQLGSAFPWSRNKWHSVELHFVRVPGAGAAVQVTVDGSNPQEGTIETFDPPFTLQVGAYCEAAPVAADVFVDDVTLHR